MRQSRHRHLSVCHHWRGLDKILYSPQRLQTNAPRLPRMPVVEMENRGAKVCSCGEHASRTLPETFPVRHRQNDRGTDGVKPPGTGSAQPEACQSAETFSYATSTSQQQRECLCWGYKEALCVTRQPLPQPLTSWICELVMSLVNVNIMLVLIRHTKTKGWHGREKATAFIGSKRHLSPVGEAHSVHESDLAMSLVNKNTMLVWIRHTGTKGWHVKNYGIS